MNGLDDLDDLLAGLAPDRETMDGLARRLVRRAEDADLVDVAWRAVDSPVGPLLLAATTAGLVKVAFAGGGHDQVLADLATTVGPRVLRAPARLDVVARQLDEYFAGRRRRVTVDLDLRLASGFRRDVVIHLPDIGWGHTESYGEVAAAVGRPRAARAVGTACATNPLPLVLPCHRVVRADGSPGQYAGGADAKRWLLAHESSG